MDPFAGPCRFRSVCRGPNATALKRVDDAGGRGPEAVYHLQNNPVNSTRTGRISSRPSHIHVTIKSFEVAGTGGNSRTPEDAKTRADVLQRGETGAEHLERGQVESNPARIEFDHNSSDAHLDEVEEREIEKFP